MSMQHSLYLDFLPYIKIIIRLYMLRLKPKSYAEKVS